jgi:hypothetical protein
MPVYPSGGTIAQSVGSPGFGPAPTPSFNASGSVRFNPADSAYISFIPSLQGARTTFTWSGWVKRSLLSSRQMIISQYQSASRTDTNTLTFEFNTSDQLRVAGESTQFLLTNAVFRDTSSWYHVQVTIETTNATTTDRVIVYVNGVRQTTSAYTAPAQNALTGWGQNGVLHYIGGLTNNSLYFGGYLADVNFVDGLALTPSSFTATDANTGQLVPIQYTGNRGTNGFYLPFSGAALAVDLGQNPKTTSQDYPYWPNSTLLVDTTSTNGQQNNTFIDSSTNNFTVTRNGNTTQGNFTPFTFGGGTTQANGYYSGYFDGTGDYLTVPTNAAFTFDGDFTVEMFANFTNPVSGVTQGLAGNGASNFSGSATALIYGHSSGPTKISFFVYNISSGTTPVLQSSTNITAGVWNHIAVTRSGTTLRLFINGQQESTFASSATIQFSATLLKLGSYWGGDFGGYLSNVRFIKGTAVYTANFTVPTTPLTNITNTSLLTCQSSQFIDNSTNAFAITTVGNSQPLPTNPFGMTAWSGYFDGTGDYLSVASNAAFGVGSGNFTIEFWIYLTQNFDAVGQGIVTASYNTNFAVIGDNSGAGNKINFWVANSILVTPTTSYISLNTWTHIACVRSSGTAIIYVNGSQVASSGSLTGTGAASALTVATSSHSLTQEMTGFISNVRLVKGTAVYTSNFTPPTAPLTAISGTSLLTCQSSTFVDNSPNAFAITVNGNPYTLTLNNPFGNLINYTTPPTQSWSNFFDGATSTRLTLPSNSAFAFGTGAYTVEAWVLATSFASAQGSVFDSGGATGAFDLSVSSAGAVVQGEYNVGNNVVTPSSAVRLNQWTHIAIVRTSTSSNSTRIYVNGVLSATGTDTKNWTVTTTPSIGGVNLATYSFPGYISNLRVVKGTAVYTSNFTPPTSPLTAIPGTSLLTCQSNRFVDNSLTNATVTKNGDARISPLSPFFPTQAWTAASNGGSGYFDGNGDNLVIDTTSALQMDANFTWEAWIYPQSLPTGGAYKTFWAQRNTAPQFGGPCVSIDSSGNYLLFISNAAATAWSVSAFDTGLNVNLNTWQHIALVKSGTTVRLYLNGVSGTPTTHSVVVGTNGGTCLMSGTTNGDQVVDGLMSNFRIVKGTALYTTPFVPPVTPFTNISNTSLLLNATNAGIYDATGINNIETVGNAQVSTAVKKFGESSMSFDGTGDYLVIPTTNAPCQFGTADFTVEGWIYPTIVTATQNLMGNRVASTGANNWDLVITSASKLAWGTTSTNYLTSTSSLLVNTWRHIAVSRVSGTTRMFINGTLEATSTSSINLSANSLFNIGSQGTFNATSNNFNGYMQDVRISKGVGRYASNFTPPAAAFAYNQYDIGNQQWLPANISVTAGVGQDNLFDSPSDYGTDTGVGGQVRGNYCTMNPLDAVGGVFANGNLDVGVTAAAGRYIRATFAPSSGKWYWEATVLSTTGTPSVGVAATTAVPSGGVPVIGVTYSSNAIVTKDSTNLGTQTSWSVNDVIGIAYDADNLTIALYRNNNIQTTVNLTTGYTYAPLFMSYANVTATSAVAFNFGQRAFAYTAPADHKCLVSTNLPVTNGIGSSASTQASKYFNPVLYTGNGSTQSIANVGFQPDFVWVKNRSTGGTNHRAFDAVRGASSVLYPSLTNAQATDTTGLTSFDSNGFSLGPTQVNDNSNNYVAWNWNAGGANATNTNGSITSTVRASTTFGFSIATFTTQSSGTATVGHGLGTAPQFFIIKTRSVADSWNCYHESIGAANKLFLNTTAASTATSDWNSTAPTSTVITLGSPWVGSYTAVGYFFAAIPGFSAFGRYTGNGSTDGPFIFTNFRPEFVMIKSSSAAGTFWVIHDAARSPSNAAPQRLFPNSDDAEVATSVGDIDILSNGFKIRNTSGSWNTSAATYIYAAFAEFPFKYSRAR